LQNETPPDHPGTGSLLSRSFLHRKITEN
jgi:hypothetical protein